MNNFLKTKTPFIIVCLLFAMFNLLFFVIADVPALQASCWVGYAFITISFILLALCTLFLKLKSKSAMTTIWPIMYVMVGYFAISLVVNLIFMLVNSDSATAAIVINVILLIIATIVFLIAFKSFSRVADNTEKRETRVAALREITVQVNALSFLTQDDEIKGVISKLKETMTYSSSAVTEAAASYQQKFIDQIETVNNLLIAKAEKQAVLDALDTANNLWKVRNQMLIAGKVN